MEKVFPLTDWSLESMRPSLITIMRRLDKLFSKIQKSAKVYRQVDWAAAAGLLRGVYLTLWKHPYIVNVPNLKSLIGICQCLIVGEVRFTDEIMSIYPMSSVCFVRTQLQRLITTISSGWAERAGEAVGAEWICRRKSFALLSFNW